MISHPRKTVFVHIPKTGGQSVESVFLEDAGVRWAERGTLVLGRNKDPVRGPTRLAHLFAAEYVALGHIAAADFDAYTRFAIVRHPYDRALSEYRYRAASWRKRNEVAMTFDDFIRWYPEDERLDVARHLVPQARYVMDDQGRRLVDHLLRFERLEEEIAPLFRRIFGAPRALPHRNASDPAAGPTRADLTPERMRVLQRRYAEDFAAFGYSG